MTNSQVILVAENKKSTRESAEQCTSEVSLWGRYHSLLAHLWLQGLVKSESRPLST